MKLLLDECVPKRLIKDLDPHDSMTVEDVGFKGLKNGELLAAAVSEGFEVVLTVDQGMPFQQQLTTLNLALIILVAKPCRYPQLKLLAPRVLETLRTINTGDVITIE